MKSIFRSIAVFLCLFIGVGNVFAESVVLTSFIGDVEYKIGEDEWTRVALFDEIPEAATVRVNNNDGYAVLTLSDGSEVKLIGLTSLYIGDVLASSGVKKQTFFELLSGKITAFVNPDTGQDFMVETETAVAAVRGTKFGASYNAGSGESSFLGIENSIEVSDKSGGNSVIVTPGMKTVASRTAPPSLPVAAAASDFSDYSVDPVSSDTADETPVVEEEETPDPVVEENEPVETETENEAADTVSASETTRTSDTDTADTSRTEDTGDTGSSDTGGDASETGYTGGSGDCAPSGFSWAIGPEVIGDQVWNKLLLTPTIKTEAFEISLYLPVYFENMDDLIHPTTWYNYEDDWNFGSGGTNFDYLDTLHDLFMKIRYMKINTDKFYLQLGNIPAMTLGHGMFIYKYRNDIQFPDVRKLGIEMEWDFGPVGIEALMSDIFEPQLWGSRLYVKPLYKKTLFKNASLGIQCFMDSAPATNMSAEALWGYGADLDVPIIDMGSFLGITFFFDIGTLGYTYETNKVYQKGWGYSTGVLGEVATIEYRAEFKSERDGYSSMIVNQFYDVAKQDIYYDIVDPGTNDASTYNGFLISAERAFENIGAIELSYEQLFPAGLEELGLDITNVDPNNNLHFEISVDRCLFEKAYGTIAYDRYDFYPKDFFANMLANSTLTFEIYYQATPGAYIGFNFERFYDEAGTADNRIGFETLMGL